MGTGTTPNTDDESGLRVELCVRSLCPTGSHRTQNAIIERLEQLEAGGILEAFDVRVWGKQVAPSTAAARTETGRRAIDRYERFREWAEEHDRSLTSFFDVRPVESRMTGDRYTAVTFPVVALAEYRDGELLHVAPCSDGETIYTVDDRLDVLEGDLPPVGVGEVEEREQSREATVPVDDGN